MRYAANHAGLRVMLTLLVVSSPYACARFRTCCRAFGRRVSIPARGALRGSRRAWVSAPCCAVYIASRGALTGLTSLAMMGASCKRDGRARHRATQNLWVAVFFGAMLGFSINVMSTSIRR